LQTHVWRLVAVGSYRYKFVLERIQYSIFLELREWRLTNLALVKKYEYEH
jgi:hypothetical protein